jgi:hypothetical protein
LASETRREDEGGSACRRSLLQLTPRCNPRSASPPIQSAPELGRPLSLVLNPSAAAGESASPRVSTKTRQLQKTAPSRRTCQSQFSRTTCPHCDLHYCTSVICTFRDSSHSTRSKSFPPPLFCSLFGVTAASGSTMHKQGTIYRPPIATSLTIWYSASPYCRRKAKNGRKRLGSDAARAWRRNDEPLILHDRSLTA